MELRKEETLRQKWYATLLVSIIMKKVGFFELDGNLMNVFIHSIYVVCYNGSTI
jgi:hypothetical protein